ncbi:MAG: FtsX-like permease family protein [Alphaproteobacteria bacterium]|nr:FtsX-like permease family protein [Alphaproteobacteria bacterium]
MAFAAVERLIALRYLRARRDEGFLSIIAGFSLIGIALGVGTLIVVMAVMNGFRVELLRQITSVNGHLAVTAGREAITDLPTVEAKIKAVPGVAGVSPVLEGQAIVAAGEQVRGIMLRGMRPEDLMLRKPIADSVSGVTAAGPQRGVCKAAAGPAAEPAKGRGDLSSLSRGRFVAIGARLAEVLGVSVGDVVTIVSPTSVDTPLGRLPRTRRFEVGAIFEVGMFDYDTNFIYASLDNARDFFETPDRTSMIEVFALDPGAYDALIPRINAVLEYKYFAFNWIEANSSFFATVAQQANVMFLVLTLIVLVAAFNIVSSLMMLVRTKGPDIAILRTIGARRGAILRVFFLDGMGLGVVGTALGVGLGVAFADNIEAIRQWLQCSLGLTLFDPQLYQLTELPARIAWDEIAGIAAMALLFCFLATIYPAWVATRLDPIEGLRRG